MNAGADIYAWMEAHEDAADRIGPALRPTRLCDAANSNDDLRLAERVEDLAVEEFVAKTRVESLDVTVLPGLRVAYATWLSDGRFYQRGIFSGAKDRGHQLWFSLIVIGYYLVEWIALRNTSRSCDGDLAQEDKALDVVDEICHSDLGRCSGDPDSSDE